jgi:hypothetical protein
LDHSPEGNLKFNTITSIGSNVFTCQISVTTIATTVTLNATLVIRFQGRPFILLGL